MLNRAFNSFRYRQFLVLLLVAAFAQGVVVLVTISAQQNTLRQLEETAQMRKASAVANVISMPLINGNTAELMRIFKEISEVEQVFSVALQRADGSHLVWVSGGERLTNSNFATSTVDIHNPTDATSPPLGRLSMRIAPLAAINRFAELQNSVLAGAIAVFLVQALLAWIVAKRFSSPLSRLLETIRRIHHGRLSQPVSDTESPGEIGEVARALERFRCDAIDVARMRQHHERRTTGERKGILSALDAAGEGLLFLDDKNNIIFANERAYQYAGTQGHLSGLLAQITEREVREQLSEAIATNCDYATTTELTLVEQMQPTGTCADTLLAEPLPVRLRANPIFHDDGDVVGKVILITDATEEVRVASRIRRLADHDTLTGLYNRQYLENKIDEGLSEDISELTLLMLDLDRFKSINDALGHMVGDDLLVHVADHLRHLTGRDGLTFRLGGDEFAILLQGDAQSRRATDLAQKVVDSFRKPQTVGERQLLTGASIGIAAAGAQHTCAKDVLHMADLALYEAKRQGRGRYIVFEAALADAIARKSDVEDAMRTALRDREITAHFQQQRGLPGRELMGFEALARWTSATLGPVSPGEFVPIAEENGLIAPLTQQMVEYAARSAAKWRKQGFTGRVSVNISPILFADDVVEVIQDAILSTACPADVLEIEITEAVFLDQGNRALQQIERLRAMGITVALDDFGTGYSSLGYLQRFPVDKIKIDRAFVSRMQGSEMTRSIVKAIVEMGHALNMSVIGEGAESEADVECLIQTGVDTVQGFVDGKPMSSADANALVDTNSLQPTIGVANTG